MATSDHPAESEAVAAEPLAALPAVSRVVAALPDLATSLLFLATAFAMGFLPAVAAVVQPLIPEWAFVDTETLLLVAGLEAFLMWPQLILMDLATRVLKRRNPILIAFVVVVAAVWLVFFAPRLWQTGTAHFFAITVPVILAIAQRVRMLWTLPGAPVLDRIRVRAVMAGRLNIALAVAAPLFLHDLVGGLLGTAAGIDWGVQLLSSFSPAPCVAAALYFALAAFDQWRVGGAAFARRPSVIFWLDLFDVKRTDGSI
jgi:hypothetical protein